MNQTDITRINALLHALYLSLSDLHEKDASLFRDGISERCICARLMSYLENNKARTWFEDYFVDVEYNRGDHGLQKAIVDSSAEIIGNITLDLVVHGRGQRGEMENLLCLEAKKASARPESKEKDRRRLKALTAPEKDVYPGAEDYHVVAGYLVGVYYEFNTKTKTILTEVYRNGELCGTSLDTFSKIVQFRLKSQP